MVAVATDELMVQGYGREQQLELYSRLDYFEIAHETMILMKIRRKMSEGKALTQQEQAIVGMANAGMI